MKVMPFFVATGLLLLVPRDFARAGTIAQPETVGKARCDARCGGIVVVRLE